MQVDVADEAFPLKKHLMRPYPGKVLTPDGEIFNYRLSRARRTIENTFEIMVARWRLLRQPIIAKLDNLDIIIKCMTVLHNYMMYNDNFQYAALSDGDLECPLQRIGRLGSNNRELSSSTQKNVLCKYLSTKGVVEYQYEK